MPTTMIICDCEHEFQDKEYGSHKRVANVKDSKPTECTCTVCGRIRPSKTQRVEPPVDLKKK